MTRAPSTFRQADLTKALKAAAAAGLHVAGYKISARGEIQVVIGESQAQNSNGGGREANEWDAI